MEKKGNSEDNHEDIMGRYQKSMSKHMSIALDRHAAEKALERATSPPPATTPPVQNQEITKIIETLPVLMAVISTPDMDEDTRPVTDLPRGPLHINRYYVQHTPKRDDPMCFFVMMIPHEYMIPMVFQKPDEPGSVTSTTSDVIRSPFFTHTMPVMDESSITDPAALRRMSGIGGSLAPLVFCLSHLINLYACVQHRFHHPRVHSTVLTAPCVHAVLKHVPRALLKDISSGTRFLECEIFSLENQDPDNQVSPYDYNEAVAELGKLTPFFMSTGDEKNVQGHSTETIQSLMTRKKETFLLCDYQLADKLITALDDKIPLEEQRMVFAGNSIRDILAYLIKPHIESGTHKKAMGVWDEDDRTFTGSHSKADFDNRVYVNSAIQGAKPGLYRTFFKTITDLRNSLIHHSHFHCSPNPPSEALEPIPKPPTLSLPQLLPVLPLPDPLVSHKTPEQEGEGAKKRTREALEPSKTLPDPPQKRQKVTPSPSIPNHSPAPIPPPLPTMRPPVPTSAPVSTRHLLALSQVEKNVIFSALSIQKRMIDVIMQKMLPQ